MVLLQADINWQPARDRFAARARMIAAIRRELDGDGFLEVETPVLQPLYGGAAARPFTTHHNQLDRDLYLRIATELYLKRCIVGGLEKVYELGKDFRNEGVSFKHNPEFTMLEWYEAYADYRDTMARIEELVERVALRTLGTTSVTFREREVDLRCPWRRVRFVEALRDRIKVRVDVGEVGRLELVRAEAEVASARTLASSARLQQVTALAQFRAAVGGRLPVGVELSGALEPTVTLPAIEALRRDHPDADVLLTSQHPQIGANGKIGNLAAHNQNFKEQKTRAASRPAASYPGT